MLGCQSNKVVLFNIQEDIQIDDLSVRERESITFYFGLRNSRKCELWLHGLAEKSLHIKFDNHLIGKDSLQTSTWPRSNLLDSLHQHSHAVFDKALLSSNQTSSVGGHCKGEIQELLLHLNLCTPPLPYLT